MLKLLALRGGSIRYNAEVTEITSRNGQATGVKLASGERLEAPIVVSNADVGWTYSRLLGAHPRKRWTDRKLDRTSFSMSLFVWYFGTNRRYEDVYHHMMVLGPRYEELLGDIFDRKVVAEDFSLYLHRPTATDPALAPPGCDAFYVLAPVPNLRGGADWATLAEPYRLRVQKRLEDTVMPGLGESIVSSRVMTPLDFRDNLLSLHGAAFSIEPQLLQSAWFRPHNRSEELRGLYIVGAGTHPGAGMPGVLSAAKIVDRLVAEDFPTA
jgi:phytoene desaturase